MAGTVGRISAYEYGGPTRQGGGGIFQPPSMSDIAGGAFPALGRDNNLPGYNLPVGFNPGSFNWFPATKQTTTASMGQTPGVFGEPRSTAGKIGDDIFVRLARAGGGDYGFFTELIAKEIVKRWGPAKHHIFGVGGISLPDNPPQILLDQEITRNPITIRRYRYFSGYWKESAAPLVMAGDLTQQRLEALSRIFPGMINISKELAKGRERMYGPSKSPQDAMNNIQNYANDLYKAEGFIDEVFADKMVQGYIKRKTNMPFEAFKKGFEDRSQKVITQNIRLPQAQKSLADAWGKATRGSVRKNKGSGWRGPTPYEVKTQEYLGNVYRPVTTGGRKGRKKITTGYQMQTKPKAGRGRPAQWSDKLTSVADYDKMLKEAQAKARGYFVGPQEKQIQEYQDYLVSTPQFGDYTMFRPFEPNWTPGTPQLGLPEDAPGPDIDTLKERLTITDGYYGGMGGGGFPQTRFGVTVPRMSQRGMARQA